MKKQYIRFGTMFCGLVLLAFSIAFVVFTNNKIDDYMHKASNYLIQYAIANNVNTIIIDAHSCVPKIRKEICDMGFIIADEKIIKEDGIFYEIIKFIRSGKALYGENDFEFGPILRNEKCATFKEKYQERINEIDAILSEKELPANRLNDLINEKNRIKGAL